MRNEYYKFLSENKITDIFISLPEISYKMKLQILQKLKEYCNPEQINYALNKYEFDYIKLNRVDIKRLYNTLKGIIDRSNIL